MMAFLKKVLLADDNLEFCRNISDILELKDYQVVTAHDGHEALELAKNERFDLALMDVRMPVMDGLEAFDRMQSALVQVPVIMMSAFAVEENLQQKPIYAYLKKPIDFDRLMALLDNLEQQRA
ncbi:MAG TPA: response regulator [bacterium]|nr:response regulator [bacterium]